MNDFIKKQTAISLICENIGHPTDAIIKIKELPSEAPEENKITFCRDCSYVVKDIDACHGNTNYYCKKLQRKVERYFFCGYGKGSENKC